jgi:ferredoxin
MIGTQPKPLSEVVDAIGPPQSLFVIGCGGCAKVCHTGGDPEVEEMAQRLEAEGYTVLAKGVPERTCYIQHVRAFFDERQGPLRECDSIVVLGCGGAVQTVRQATEERALVKNVVSALNSIGHMDTVIPDALWVERCSECGDCMLNETGGICPITLCAKGLVNGPCGGSRNGKCETDPERDCAWELIYRRLQILGKLDSMRKIRSPRDHSKANRPRKITYTPSPG